MILAPELAPITFAFGLLEAPLGLVSDELKRWYGGQSVRHELVSVNGTLVTLLHQLEPLSAPFFKRLWVKTASSRWQTAYFDGFVNGGDPFPPVSYLARTLGLHGLVVASQPNSSKCYGGNKLELYGPVDTAWLNLIWGVAALNDGGQWVWQRSGTDQPFEEMSAYANRRVKDRFTPEMLQRYCAALEVPLDPSAYGPDALLDTPAGIESTKRRETLSNARARLGL